MTDPGAEVALQGPDPGPGRGLRRLLVHGTGAAAIVAAALHLGGALGLLDALYLSGLLILLPVLAVAQLPLASEEILERIPAYLGSMALIALLGLVALVLGVRAVGLERLGLGALGWSTLLGHSAALTAAGMGLVGVFHVTRRRLGVAETPLVSRLLPSDAREKVLFSLLSLTAGAGEELAFRGYAIAVLQAAVAAPWLAVVVSSVSFGFLHAYQGWLGIARTSTLGLLFALYFVEVGSLWPIMAAHAAIDLLAGLLLGERLVRP